MIPLARKGKTREQQRQQNKEYDYDLETEKVSSALVQRICLACLCTEGRQNVLLQLQAV